MKQHSIVFYIGLPHSEGKGDGTIQTRNSTGQNECQ